MKKMIVIFSILGAFCTAYTAFCGDEIFRSSETVRVNYQYRNPNAKNWTNSSTSLRNVTTESMIRNQVASRHGNAEVRILSAQTGNSHRAQVRYQYKKLNGNSWINSSTTLADARTESMAVNQLKAKHPDSAIRIISIKHQ